MQFGDIHFPFSLSSLVFGIIVGLTGAGGGVDDPAFGSAVRHPPRHRRRHRSAVCRSHQIGRHCGSWPQQIGHLADRAPPCHRVGSGTSGSRF